jgi:signal peptidase II
LRLKILLIAVLVVALDQATKSWMSAHLADLRIIHVLPGLAWELSHNNGAAFGMMEGGNLQLIVAATLAVFLLLYWVRQAGTWSMAIALGLLLGGALGNLIDRVRLGHVVDFIAIQYRGQTVFPNFNVADSAITVGAFLLAYSWYRSEHARSERADDPEPVPASPVGEEA